MFNVLLAAVGLSAALSPALQAAPVSTAPAAVPTPVVKKICRIETQTGSIMPARRICRTREDWSAIDKAGANSASSLMQQREHGSMGAQGY